MSSLDRLRRLRFGAVLVLLAPWCAAGADAAESLVDQGRRIFFAEKFNGNGRTCGTCHPADNNYTIDPAYISGLPANDPLFVAEYNPVLRGLERPKLLRGVGLVVVNVDGFDKPGVLRGVPHLLGLRHSIAVEPGSLTAPGGSGDLAAALGWSGDGAPGRGSLREFALGAVKQHLTRSLQRRPGTDFRVPTAAELRALEAFMLSLGRTGALDLATGLGVTFKAALVDRGRQLFNNEVSGSCAFCHANATALNEGGFNAMFDIGISERSDTPGRRRAAAAGIPFPGDGGFGRAPVISVAGEDAYGDGRMNTPSLIEAADTAPFFHDNSEATIEAAVRYYTTAAFADSPEGQSVSQVRLSEGDVIAIAALLRTLNALENIPSSNALLGQAVGKPAAVAILITRLAISDTVDGLGVLTRGPVRLYDDARGLMRSALKLEEHAATTSTAAVDRDRALRQAIQLKEQARGRMVNS